MKWNNKKPNFRSTDERIIVLFAYTPIQCDNGHTHWLERVKVKQFWGPYSQKWCSMGTRGELFLKECYCPNSD